MRVLFFIFGVISLATTACVGAAVIVVSVLDRFAFRRRKAAR